MRHCLVATLLWSHTSVIFGYECRVWSLINHSELSCMRFDSGVSCLAFRVNDHSEAAGQFWSLIVGMESGEIAELRIYSENDHKAAIHKTDASWHSEAWPTQEIEQVECSPNGQWIVAGTSKGINESPAMLYSETSSPISPSGGIEVFDGTVPGLKHVWRCAHSTRTKSLDFSVDGSILRSTDMAGELLLWNLPNRVQVSCLRQSQATV
jgi:WD40 repeat protein